MRIFAAAVLIVLSTSCFAESPYAGQEQRPVKALSEKEVQDLLAGKGMGLAKAAELNHYPGPAHVLELAAKLDLSEEQLRQTRAIHGGMQNEAIRLGRQLVEKERVLDQLFATGRVTPGSLGKTLEEIGSLQAALRRTHLQAHLDQRKILSDEQVRRYDRLRGYDGSGGAVEHSGHQH